MMSGGDQKVNPQDDTQVCEQYGERLELAVTNPLLRRAMLFLEEGDWGRADDYCEQVLNQEPENAMAYVIKLMARLRITNEQELGAAPVSFGDWYSYQNACRYADDALRSRLDSYLTSTKQHLQHREEEKLRQEQEELLETVRMRNASLYSEGCRLQKAFPEEKNLKEALQRFEKIPDYMDSLDRARQCRVRLSELKVEQERQAYEEERTRKKVKITRRLGIAAALLAVILVAALIVGNINRSNAERQARIARNLVGMQFEAEYTDYSDNATNDFVGMAEKWYEYEVMYCFGENGKADVYTLTRYDNYPFILRDGVHQWDGTTHNYTTVSCDVQVSFFGNVTITINGSSCKLTVDENDVPVSILIENVEYKPG